MHVHSKGFSVLFCREIDKKGTMINENIFVQDPFLNLCGRRREVTGIFLNFQILTELGFVTGYFSCP
jgi:hypothetical protein